MASQHPYRVIPAHGSCQGSEGTTSFTFTDDPADPCSLCVGWVEADDPNDWEAAYPINADGSRVERIYSFIHDSCEKSAMLYSSESHS